MPPDPNTTRPSRVPGLLVRGTASYGYSLHWHSPAGRLVAVMSTDRREYGNMFARVADARAAADRLAPLLDWSGDGPAMIRRVSDPLARAMIASELAATLRGDPVTYADVARLRITL